MKKGKKGMLFAVIMGVLLISTALAYMTSTWIVANSMTVRIRDVNITVYSDDACTKPLTSLSWGEIKQGDRKEKIFWIKNVGKDNGTAAWYSDLEHETDWNADDDMYYWNETLGEWVHWWESWMPYPTPTPTPTTKQVTGFGQSYKATRWGEGPWMEPGDVVKVKYVIELEASCEPRDYNWTLYLGWE